MSHLSKSNQTSEQKRPWLQEYYEAKRQRTVNLVTASVDHLRRRGEKVTIAAICHVSRELDPNGKGIEKTGILGNTEAYAYYRKYSVTYLGTHQRRQRSRHILQAQSQYRPERIDPDRDEDSVRRRYLTMTKVELVERLLILEQSYVQIQQQQARVQYELLNLQLAQLEAKSPAAELIVRHQPVPDSNK